MCRDMRDDIQALFDFLEETDETEKGTVFHPNTLSTVRVLNRQRMADIVTRLKSHLEEE